MSDSYSYGGPAKGRRVAGSIDGVKLALGVLVAAIALAGAYAVVSVLRGGGEVAADSAKEVVAQIDVAKDAEAQVALTRVAVAAQGLLAQADLGTVDVATAEALAEMEPAFMYTGDASTGPEVVSVAAGSDGWSAAVLSSSGSCLWIRIDPSGAQAFGAGTPCTGTAAAAASHPSW